MTFMDLIAIAGLFNAAVLLPLMYYSSWAQAKQIVRLTERLAELAEAVAGMCGDEGPGGRP